MTSATHRKAEIRREWLIEAMTFYDDQSETGKRDAFEQLARTASAYVTAAKLQTQTENLKRQRALRNEARMLSRHVR